MLHLLYLPPNITSNHQPCDMGVIESLKVGDKSTLLRKILSVYEEPNAYPAALERRDKAPKGCRGLAEGCKAHMLVTLQISKEAWTQGKYVTRKGIIWCWRHSSSCVECCHQQSGREQVYQSECEKIKTKGP